MRSRAFDVEIQYNGHTLQVTGSYSPYVPPTGPSMENAGGDPAEGGEIEDMEVKVLWRSKVGNWRRRDLCEKITASLDIDAEIWEKLDEEADDGPDPDEERDRKMDGD